MKILFAISAPMSILLLRGQAAYNKDQGAQVYLATAFDEHFVPVIKDEGFEYVEINLEREISVIKDIKAMFEAIKILKEIKPDMVNASTPKAGLIFMIASWFTKVPAPIFTLRGLRSNTLTGVKKQIVHFTEWLTCHLAKKVIVISPSLRDFAVERKIVNPKKAIVIGKGSSNGINVKRFNPASIDISETEKLKTEWDIPINGFVYGYIGRIVKDKGVEEMYLAFKELRNENAFLVLTGNYEAEDAISADIYEEMKNNPQVRFLGFSKQIPLIISAFDVLILFSYREGFGNVALEASCMGKPIIVSDIVGLSDTVEDGITGFKVQSKHIDGLNEKMQFYLNHEVSRKKHGLNGRNRVLKHFSSPYIHSELFKIYKSELFVSDNN